MIKITVKNGYPQFVDNASMRNYQKIMDAYSNSGKVLEIKIEEFSPDTTEKQHSLFKAMLMQVAMVSGYTFKEVEEELINSFAPYNYETTILGDKLKKRKSVPEMSHKEFNIFIDQCTVFVNEFYGLNF
jgi:hypothetical protein